MPFKARENLTVKLNSQTFHKNKRILQKEIEIKFSLLIYLKGYFHLFRLIYFKGKGKCI